MSFSFSQIFQQVYEQQTAEREKNAGNGQGHTAKGWRSSSLGSCKRGQFLARLLSGQAVVQHDLRTEGIFELGHIIEAMWVKKLKEHPDYIVFTQGEMRDDFMNLTGHFDALVINKVTGEVKMFECKSKNSNAFKFMGKEGANHHHKLQLSSYMHMVNNHGFTVSLVDFPQGAYKFTLANPYFTTVISPDGETAHVKLSSVIESGAVFYVSKDDQKTAEYPIFSNDQALIQEWTSELNELNIAWDTQGVLPMYDKKDWQCKYCAYCQAGLCETMDSYEVVRDVMKVASAKLIQTKITK